jgi:hypothetical protein
MAKLHVLCFVRKPFSSLNVHLFYDDELVFIKKLGSASILLKKKSVSHLSFYKWYGSVER